MPEPATIALFSTGCIAVVFRYIKRQYTRIKPLFDKLMAGILLVLAGPAIAFGAFLVKLTSRGPAFYTQDRVGANGSVFKIIKLRTMKLNAEANTGPVWTPGRDERITSRDERSILRGERIISL